MNPSAFTCPECGSEDTRRLSIIYAEGTGISHGGGVGVVDHHMAFVGTSGRTQSMLAASMAPPQRKTYLAEGFAAGVAGLIVGVVVGAIAPGPNGGFLGFLAFAAVAGVAFYLMSAEAREFNNYEFPQLLQEWELTLLCRRCGHVFLEGAPDSRGAPVAAPAVHASPAAERARRFH